MSSALGTALSLEQRRKMKRAVLTRVHSFVQRMFIELDTLLEPGYLAVKTTNFLLSRS